MRLVRDLQQVNCKSQYSVVTMGCFDGVHLGHQKLIQRVLAVAKDKQYHAWVVSFEPYPVEVLNAAHVPVRLTRWREKYEILQQQGITNMLCLHFNKQLAQMSAENFIDVLVKQLRLKHFIVGEDCHFGKDRKGNINLLKRYSKILDYHLEVIPKVSLSGKRVSSTLVRTALAQGDLSYVQELLGRPFELMGRVIHGKKLGRQLGYPTANLLLRRNHQGCSGIYLVKVIVAQQYYDGVASIGMRPTVNGREALIEVHLFNYNASLYGRLLRVQLLKKLREEQCFDSVAAMQQQIERDIVLAQTYCS